MYTKQIIGYTIFLTSQEAAYLRGICIEALRSDCLLVQFTASQIIGTCGLFIKCNKDEHYTVSIPENMVKRYNLLIKEYAPELVNQLSIEEL